jgi:mediator of RNA polymerase II transcription subunit 1
VELQKSLDLLQQSIKVNSLQSLTERLEMVSRQQGLKFTTATGSSGNEWFISSDMFYLELLIDSQGTVQEVKIQHDGKAEQQVGTQRGVKNPYIEPMFMFISIKMRKSTEMICF